LSRKNLSTIEQATEKDPCKVESDRSHISKEEGFSKVWEILKDTVKNYLGKHRMGMMLFLDDLPLQLGAYHPLGTNNIILNRTLVQSAEASTKSKQLVEALGSY
jgi:hypothetical protein